MSKSGMSARIDNEGQRRGRRAWPVMSRTTAHANEVDVMLGAPLASLGFHRRSAALAIAAFGFYEVSFWLAYRYGMSFSQATASPFWFPDSVLLCALLLTPSRLWWVFVLGPLPLRLFLPEAAGIPLWFLLSAFLVDSAKGVVAAWVLRRCIPDPLNLRTVQEFAVYCLIAVAVVPGAASFGGASLRSMLGANYWLSWEQWFLGDALAQSVLTPAILWGLPSAAKVLASSRARITEGIVLVAGIAFASYFAFWSFPVAGGVAEPRFYLPVPLLFWAALRFGMFGASVAILITSVISVEAALMGHGPFTGDSPANTALALQQFLLLRAAPLYVVAILFEQKKSAEEALTRSERRYRDVVESQTELVCRFLPNGAVSFVNDAFCRAFGRSRHALLGSDFLALLPQESHDQARTRVVQAGQRIVDRGEWECREVRDDGTIGWRNWLCHPIINSLGNVEEFQVIGQDVTDRKRAEEADRKLTHASRLAVVGELTAMVAHEVNQPLGAILSNADAAEMLLDSADPPLGEIRAILADIRRSDLRASEAVLRIRALLSKHEIQLRPIDLNETISDALGLVAADLRRRQVEVRTDLAPALPAVSGDRVYLQQVLLNLFVNAMDSMSDTPATSRLLDVTSLREGPDRVEVIVADCGHGIAPERTSKIFESFYSTKTDGMGLGLSIARSIVRTHRGRLWAENKPDGGAAFHFTVMNA